MAAEFSAAEPSMGGDSEYWNWWWQNYSYWYWIQSSGYGWQQGHGDYDDQYKQWLEYFNSNAQGDTMTVAPPIRRVRLRMIGNLYYNYTCTK